MEKRERALQNMSMYFILLVLMKRRLLWNEASSKEQVKKTRIRWRQKKRETNNNKRGQRTVFYVWLLCIGEFSKWIISWLVSHATFAQSDILSCLENGRFPQICETTKVSNDIVSNVFQFQVTLGIFNGQFYANLSSEAGVLCEHERWWVDIKIHSRIYKWAISKKLLFTRRAKKLPSTI